MRKFDKWSALGHSALGLMCVVWVFAGWQILLDGGFYSKPRGVKVSTYVDGAGATIMALILLSLASISAALILKRLNVRREISIATSAGTIGFPLAYLIAQRAF